MMVAVGHQLWLVLLLAPGPLRVWGVPQPFSLRPCRSGKIDFLSPITKNRIIMDTIKPITGNILTQFFSKQFPVAALFLILFGLSVYVSPALSCDTVYGIMENPRECIAAGVDVNLQDKYGDTVLTYTSGQNKPEIVKLLLKAGADVNRQDGDTRTALMVAAAKGNADVTRILLSSGATVDLQDKYGNTALIYASRKNKPEIVKLLLKAGADVNHQKDNTSTALMIAAAGGNADPTRILLSSGATVDLQDKFGNTALMDASEKGTYETVKLLLDAGATVDLQDEEGNTALIDASRNKYPEIIKLLLQAGLNVNHQNKYKNTALMIAAGKERVEVVRVLLSSGATVDLQDEVGDTALRYASWNKNPEIVKLLLRAGLDVNHQNKFGQTSLMQATTSGKLEVVRTLLSSGATVDLQSSPHMGEGWMFNRFTGKYEVVMVKVEGETALINAAQKGHSEVIKLLLAAGADPDLQTKTEGRTALMAAARNGEEEAVQVLLNAGANPDLQNKNGETAFRIATAKKREKVIKLLIAAGVQMGQEDREKYAELLKEKERKIRKELEEKKQRLLADMHKQDSRGRISLMKAAKDGDWETVNILVNGGVDVNMQDERGWTALMYLASSNDLPADMREKIGELLINGGAKVDLQSKEREGSVTALTLAARYKENLKLVYLLLARGADPKQRSHGDKTALMHAAQYGNAPVARALINLGADVNLQRDGGTTALMYAVDYDKKGSHAKVTEQLLRSGADPNLGSKDGDLPIHKALREGNAQQATLLLEAGASFDIPRRFKLDDLKKLIDGEFNVNQQDEQTGISLLHFFLSRPDREDSIDAITLLVKAGANPNLADKRGNSALLSAIENSQKKVNEIAQYLIDNGARVDQMNLHGETPLTSAIQGWKNMELVALLINAGADVNGQKSSGETPLFLASFRSKDYVPILERAGAKLTEAEKQQLASKSCGNPASYKTISVSEAKACIKAGAHIDFIDEERTTPLEYAARGQNLEVVKLLLEEGVSVETSSRYNSQTFGLAVFKADCFENVPEICDIFLEAGADINAGNRVLNIALQKLKRCKKGDRQVALANIKYLIERGADPSNELGYASEHHIPSKLRITVLKILLENGDWSTEHAKKKMNTLLAYTQDTVAADKRLGFSTDHERKVIELLMKFGAKNNEEDYRRLVELHPIDFKLVIEDGRDLDKHKTLLMTAIDQRQVVNARALIEAGADVNARDYSGNTPLMIAAKKEQYTLVKDLLDKGAKSNLINDRGKSALLLAVDSLDIFSVKYLLEDHSNLTPALLNDALESAVRKWSYRKGQYRQDVNNAQTKRWFSQATEICSQLLQAGAKPNPEMEWEVKLLQKFINRSKLSGDIASQDPATARSLKEDRALGKKVLISIVMPGDNEDNHLYAGHRFFMDPQIFPTIDKRYEISGRDNNRLTIQAFLATLKNMTRDADTVVLIYNGHGIPSTVSDGKPYAAGLGLTREYRYCNEDYLKLIDSYAPDDPRKKKALQNLENAHCNSDQTIAKYEDIAKVLRGKRVLFINSTCYAGSAEKAMRPILGDNLMLLAAAQPDEISWSFISSNFSDSDRISAEESTSGLYSSLYIRTSFPLAWEKLDRNQDHLLTADELLSDFPESLSGLRVFHLQWLTQRTSSSFWQNECMDLTCLEPSFENLESRYSHPAAHNQHSYIRMPSGAAQLRRLIVRSHSYFD